MKNVKYGQNLNCAAMEEHTTTVIIINMESLILAADPKYLKRSL